MNAIYTKVKQFEAVSGGHLANLIQEWANVNVIEIANISYAVVVSNNVEHGSRHYALVTYRARKYEEVETTANKTTPSPNP